MFTVGIIRVERRGEPNLCMAMEGLNPGEAAELAIPERSQLMPGSAFAASEPDNKVSAEGAGKSRGCCLWAAVVERPLCCFSLSQV